VDKTIKGIGRIDADDALLIVVLFVVVARCCLHVTAGATWKSKSATPYYLFPPDLFAPAMPYLFSRQIFSHERAACK